MSDSRKLCRSCPSFLGDMEAASFFRKGIGAPMCARFGHALGRPGISEAGREKIEASFAGSCSSYGQPRPGMPVEVNLQVASPSPDVLEVGMVPSGDPRKENCPACTQCANFVPSYIVASEMGWGAGLCAATGRLILDNRVKMEAMHCDWRQTGPTRSTTSDMFLRRIYDEAVRESASSDPVFAIAETGEPVIIEPMEYETDFPVSDEDTKSGIRAWRKIVNPEDNSLATVLPIFDPEFFDVTERELIPRTGDDEHPEDYVDHQGLVYDVAADWSEMDDTPMLWGPAGTGKTELYRHLAWMMCMPFYRISVTGSTEVDDLIGKMEYDPEHGTYPRYGRLVEAWQKPGVICLDEPNAAQDPAVWHALRPLTDNSKQMVLDQLRGERVPRHGNCYFGMAANPAWDIRNVGVLNLADADGSRLSHHMVQLPPELVERAILRKACSHDGYDIPKDKLDLIMKVAVDIRTLASQGTIPISWGIRQQIRVARNMRVRSVIKAYRTAAADFLEPDAANLILDAVKTYIR